MLATRLLTKRQRDRNTGVKWLFEGCGSPPFLMAEIPDSNKGAAAGRTSAYRWGVGTQAKCVGSQLPPAPPTGFNPCQNNTVHYI